MKPHKRARIESRESIVNNQNPQWRSPKDKTSSSVYQMRSRTSCSLAWQQVLLFFWPVPKTLKIKTQLTEKLKSLHSGEPNYRIHRIKHVIEIINVHFHSFTFKMLTAMPFSTWFYFNITWKLYIPPKIWCFAMNYRVGLIICKCM